jgi:DNA repair exonuclease SbcCD ATPase subunit
VKSPLKNLPLPKNNTYNMKFTILPLNDRLNTIIKQAKSMVKSIPIDEMQKHWDNFIKNVTDKLNDSLQDHIELLNMKLADQEDASRVLQDINANLTLRNVELEAKIESLLASQTNHMRMSDAMNNAEYEIIELKKSLAVEISNRDHFRSLVAQQDVLLTEFKKQNEMARIARAGKQSKIDELKASLQSKTEEAEHLAKQAIRLTEENTSLIQKNVELKAVNDQLNDQTPRLIEENNKFREQTTRLIEEKRNLSDQLNGYECLGCRTGELLYPWVEKLSKKFFPPKGIGYTTLSYASICKSIDDELAKRSSTPTHQTLQSMPETCGCSATPKSDVKIDGHHMM